MTDVVFTQQATVRSAAPDAVPSKGDGRNVKLLDAYRLTTALVVTNTIKFGRIDSNARIHGGSSLKNSANAASATLSLGLASVNNNFGAAVPAALLAATAITSAANTTFPALSNAGKMAWEIAGLSSDPGGQFEVYGTVGGATLNAGADLLVSLSLTID